VVQEILGQNFMPSMKLKLGRNWTFQMDNDPKYTLNSSLVAVEVLEDSTEAISHLT